MAFFTRAFGLTAMSFGAGALANGLSSAGSPDSTVYAAVTEANHPKPRIYRSNPDVAFNADFQKYRLGEIFNIAEDVAVFRFLLRDPEHVFDLPACSTLQMASKTVGSYAELNTRAYTPVTPNGEKGYFDILVKKQSKGRMTEFLWTMKPGDFANFRCQMYKMQYRANERPHIGMIGGGTGITPLLQVIRANIYNPEDKTKMTLVFGNKTESKILLRGLLDDMATRHADKFKVHYAISDLEDFNKASWKGHVGHIDRNLLIKTMPPAKDPRSLVMICGPDPMMHTLAGVGLEHMRQMWNQNQQGSGSQMNNAAELGGVLASMGYNGEQVYRF